MKPYKLKPVHFTVPAVHGLDWFPTACGIRDTAPATGPEIKWTVDPTEATCPECKAVLAAERDIAKLKGYAASAQKLREFQGVSKAECEKLATKYREAFPHAFAPYDPLDYSDGGSSG